MKSIPVTTSVCLTCASTAGDVYILVDKEVTVTGFDYILGQVASVEYLVDDKGTPYFIYGISYDETDLLDPVLGLEEHNLRGISCTC